MEEFLAQASGSGIQEAVALLLARGEIKVGLSVWAHGELTDLENVLEMDPLCQVMSWQGEAQRSPSRLSLALHHVSRRQPYSEGVTLRSGDRTAGAFLASVSTLALKGNV